MGVERKNKRKIIYKDRLYYWYVREDFEECGDIYLNVISDDKKFIVSYKVGQSKISIRPFIIVKGKEFNGLKNSGHIYTRIATPNWNDEIITPSLVIEIIDWCYRDKEQVVIVDWENNTIQDVN